MASITFSLALVVGLQILAVANGLECETCLKVGVFLTEPCVNQTCVGGTNRCAAMSFTATIADGSTHQGWVKNCQNDQVCPMDSTTLCQFARTYNQTVAALLQQMVGCNLVCAETNDLQIPAYIDTTSPTTAAPTVSPTVGDNAGVVTSVSIVTAVATLAAATFFVVM